MERARRSIQYQQRIIAEQTKTLQDWLELDHFTTQGGSSAEDFYDLCQWSLQTAADRTAPAFAAGGQ